jgi:arylsulfatase A-like enzyme
MKAQRALCQQLAFVLGLQRCRGLPGGRADPERASRRQGRRDPQRSTCISRGRSGIPFAHLPEELKRRNVGLYNALYWVDVCIRGLFETLEHEGLFDEHTVILLTADHSPNPGVEYRRAVPPEEYLRLGRLPLIVAMRDRERLAGLDTAGFASQVDLAPTVLAMVGCEAARLRRQEPVRAAATGPRSSIAIRSAIRRFGVRGAVRGRRPEPTVRRVALRSGCAIDVDLPTPGPARAHAR